MLAATASGFGQGHGNGSNDYAVGVKSQLINRFARNVWRTILEPGDDLLGAGWFWSRPHGRAGN